MRAASQASARVTTEMQQTASPVGDKPHPNVSPPNLEGKKDVSRLFLA